MLSSIKRINQYSFNCNDKIGDGCTSEVFLGTHQKNRERVAIKIISKMEHRRQENIAIAEKEIKSLHNFKGKPNIIQLHHASQTKNNIYIIMDLCELGTLGDLLQSKPRLSEQQAKRYLLQIINGYKYLAEKSIIHRDLKPLNIFVKKTEELVIGDFGFAVQLEKGQETFVGTAGSPYYMAPEVLFESIHSTKSDIWSIGMIYLEMLEGCVPWKSKRQGQLIAELERFDLSKHMSQKLSEQSKEFLRKALTKDVKNRMNIEQLLAFSETKEEIKLISEFKQEAAKIIRNSNGHNITKTNSVSTDGSDKSMNFEYTNQTQADNSSLPSPNSKHVKYQLLWKNLQADPVKSPQEKSKPDNLKHYCQQQQKKKTETKSPVTFFQQNIETIRKQRNQPTNQSVNSKAYLDQRQILSQIEAQVNFFRFVFKLYKKMKEMIKGKDRSINAFKQHLLQLTFNILNQAKNVKNLAGIPEEKLIQFKSSDHFKEAMNILEQYRQRYIKQQQKDQFECSYRGDKYFTKLLSHVQEILYQNVVLVEKNLSELNRKKVLVFLIEDLIKLSQIFLLSRESNWKTFARKSQLKQKIDQAWPQSLNLQYWQKVKLKLDRSSNSETFQAI